MDKNSEASDKLIFEQKHSYLVALLISFLVPILLLASSKNQPGSINGKVWLVSISVGIVIFLFFFLAQPRAKIILVGSQIHYKRKSLDLSRLSEVQNIRTVILGSNNFNATFTLKLIDKDKNKISISNLGNWRNQDVLVGIIAKYARTPGVIVDERTAKLFNNEASRGK